MKGNSYLKMTVFWGVASCSLVEVYRRYRGACCLHHQNDDDDWSSKYLWNVSKLLPDYTVQYSRRQSSSYSPPWEPEVSVCTCLAFSQIVFQNPFCSSLLPKNLKIKINITMIPPFVLYGCQTWSLTSMKKHRFRVFENMALRAIWERKIF
jgi:hypothetical protein